MIAETTCNQIAKVQTHRYKYKYNVSSRRDT